MKDDVKLNEPVLHATDQSFREVVSKAFEDAGFDGTSMRRLDEFFADLARETGVQVSELRMGVEETVLSVRGPQPKVRRRVVPVLKTPYSADVVTLANHFTRMSKEQSGRGGGTAGFSTSSKRAGSSTAHDYWKNKESAETGGGGRGPNSRETSA